MKYIKTYEDNRDYKYGDIVVIDPIVFKTNYHDVPQDWLPFDLPIGKIITGGAIKYYTGFHSHIHNILRKATPEEIEEYNSRISSTKYNL